MFYQMYVMRVNNKNLTPKVILIITYNNMYLYLNFKSTYHNKK